MGIEASLERAAHQNLQTAIATSGDEYTDLEKLAMTKIEELKLVNGMDLAAVLIRGKLIHEIKDAALYTVHPENYQTLEEMAQAQGISISELSNVVDLCDTIFPYVENNLGWNVAQVWEEIGKSKFRELTSVLVCLITGEPSRSPAVNTAVDRLLNDTHATARSAGQILSDEEAVSQTVENLLTAGGQMTTVNLRRHLRPEHTEEINTTFVTFGGRQVMIAEINNEDQRLLVERALGRHMAEPDIVNLPDDPAVRRREAARCRLLREISNLISGE